MPHAKNINHEPDESEIFFRGEDEEIFYYRKDYTVWRIFWGLFFIAAAATVVLSALGILTFGVNIGWLILGLLLVAIFLHSLFSLHWFGVFIPAAAIVTILAKITDTLDITDSTIGAVWIAAGLLSIGFSVLFRSRREPHHWRHAHATSHGRQYDKHERVINSKDDSEIFVDVNFGSTVKHVNTKDFKHANFKCSFGSITAYFDDADIKKDKAIIEISASFSGIELYIPKTWHIINSINSNLAGVQEKNSPHLGENPKTVTLVGQLNLSGVEIIYV
jgi:hypothetical protein